MPEQHIAVYVRVRTRRQDTRSQEPDLTRWLEAYADGAQVVWRLDRLGRTASGLTALFEKLTGRRVAGHVSRGGITVLRLVIWRIEFDVKSKKTIFQLN